MLNHSTTLQLWSSDLPDCIAAKPIVLSTELYNIMYPVHVGLLVTVLLFVTKYIHTHPVVTTTSSTTESPNRAPRVIIVWALLSVISKLDGLSLGSRCGNCEQERVTVVVKVTAALLWMALRFAEFCWEWVELAVIVWLLWLGAMKGQVAIVASVTFLQ